MLLITVRWCSPTTPLTWQKACRNQNWWTAPQQRLELSLYTGCWGSQAFHTLVSTLTFVRVKKPQTNRNPGRIQALSEKHPGGSFHCRCSTNQANPIDLTALKPLGGTDSLNLTLFELQTLPQDTTLMSSVMHWFYSWILFGWHPKPVLLNTFSFTITFNQSACT